MSAAASAATNADAADLEWLSLDPDEEVVWVGQPAFQTLYGTIATGIVLTVFLIGFLILLGVPFSYLGIKNTDYVVTSKSLYVKKGILSTNIETVDLDRIQNTEYSQSFWGKQFGYGQIAISTAGSSGAEITFKGIPEAKAVRDRIAELQPTRSGGGSDGTTGGGAAAERGADGAPASAEQIDELIAEMRATREAFERIERQLAASDGDRNADAGAGDGTGERSDETPAGSTDAGTASGPEPADEPADPGADTAGTDDDDGFSFDDEQDG
ncbi:MAG: PH domain-containing protein [Haloferacaceae archaeon]